MTWECFLIEKEDRAIQSLRRYKHGEKCPIESIGIHNAEVVIGEEIDWNEDFDGRADDSMPHDDPRWPVSCPCGYVFTDDDEYQVNLSRVFTGGGWRGRIRRDEPRAGAMWDAWWMGETWKGADGLHLTVRLPDGTDWVIDGPASGGGHWTREGIPPLITASPSIASFGYHGFLQNGILTDDLEGRTYG